MPSHRRDGEWGNGAIVAVIAAMVVVMALVAFTPSWPFVSRSGVVTVGAVATKGEFL